MLVGCLLLVFFVLRYSSASVADREKSCDTATDVDHIFEDGNLRERCKLGVDLVYTWVNGSDPGHKHALGNILTQVGLSRDNLEKRFRDFGEASTLKYSLRSQQKYAQWLRHVWVVTADKKTQVPSFLDLHVDTISVVDHATIFPDWAKDALPTFDSCAIEMNLHRIPGLSECYLYLNDDVLFNKQLEFNMLWPESETVPYAWTNYIIAPYSSRGQDAWGTKLSNVAKSIRRETRMKRKDILLVGHHGHFFVKPVVKYLLEEVFAPEMRETALSRYRGPNSFWIPFVYSNYMFWKFHATRKRVHAFYHPIHEEEAVVALEETFEKLSTIPFKSKYAWVCFNDLLDKSVPPGLVETLKHGLETIFPHPSTYEFINSSIHD
uniref:Uncharacterized protein n=1 Tax=Mucochytrium quahogii TaxID=96639 RepID=A0A7S2RLR4_9STRA|mmetsp:Transcript_2274/g.4386  ORF Transcript_2274/g.4386 Transcript_2274/m.4386 type:complete len:379 (-) Transcript_2274:22-1158(-)